MTGGEVFAYGVIGGVIPEVYALYCIRRVWPKEKPSWVKSKFYWFITGLMICLSGGTAYLYYSMNVQLNVLMAIHLGISTPVLIQTAVKESPQID